MPIQSENWQRAETLVRKFGRHSTSFQVLLDGYQYFFYDHQVCLAFVETPQAFVVAGPVIGPEDLVAEAIKSFECHAKKNKRRVTYFATFAEPKEAVELKHVKIGQEPLYDLDVWKKDLKKNKNFQQQLRRARNKGVVVREIADKSLLDQDQAVRIELEKIIVKWQRAKPMPPMSFLVQLAPFSRREHRTYFVATKKEKDGVERFVAFAVLSPIYGANGVLLEHLIRSPEAPNGCAELIIDTIQQTQKNISRFSLGILPLTGAEHLFLRSIKHIAEDLYHFDGLEKFKKKLSPQSYQDIYLSYQKKNTMLQAFVDVAQSFTQGRAVKFALDALFYGSIFWIKCMTWMLIPWTILLAWVDTDTWFPALGIQRAWVVFDCVLFVGLWCLSRVWRQRLAWLLATLVTMDTLVTLIEACVFAYPKTSWGQGVRMLAVLAPGFSAAILWKTYLLKKKDPYLAPKKEDFKKVGKKRWYSRWSRK